MNKTTKTILADTLALIMYVIATTGLILLVAAIGDLIGVK